MVVLPVNFVKTRYTGYFWNTAEKKLYTIKRNGILRQLKIRAGGTFRGVRFEPGYKVSVNGVRRVLLLRELYPLEYTEEFELVGHQYG